MQIGQLIECVLVDLVSLPEYILNLILSHPSQYYSNQSGLNFKLLMEPNCENPFFKVITYFKRCKLILFVGLRIVKRQTKTSIQWKAPLFGRVITWLRLINKQLICWFLVWLLIGKEKKKKKGFSLAIFQFYLKKITKFPHKKRWSHNLDFDSNLLAFF